MSELLLNPKRQPQQITLAPGRSEKFDANGYLRIGEAGGKTDGRQPRFRADPAVAPSLLEFSQWHRFAPDGRVHQRIEIVDGHPGNKGLAEMAPAAQFLEIRWAFTLPGCL